MNLKSNPFSTRFFQPGEIPFHFGPSGSLGELIRRADRPGSCFVIVGPHGTGKSTLLHHLHRQILEDRGSDSVLLECYRQSEPIRTRETRDRRAWGRAEWIFVDGFEQLPLWRRAQLVLGVRRRRVRCIVTSHRKHFGLEPLWKTRIDSQVEQHVLARLLADHPRESLLAALSSDEWILSRLRHGENVRESLFDMYDWWQKHEAGISERSSHPTRSHS